MALNAEDADKIVAAVEENGVKSQMFSNIYSTWARTVQQALTSGRIGELQAIHCDVLFSKGHPGTAPVGEKTDPETDIRTLQFC